MKRRLLACGMVLAVAGMGWAQEKPTTGPAGGVGEPMAVLLEQGIYQEETAGKLDAAAKTYGQIAAQAEAQRGLAAQALYRLAIVQVKQKQMTEARATVQRLAEQYPEQQDLIAKALEAVPAAVAGGVVAAGSVGGVVVRIPTPEEKAQSATLVTKGWQLMQEAKYEEADQAFRKAVDLDRSSAALNGLAWAVMNGGEGEQSAGASVSYFKEALELDPKNAAALNGLGRYYMGQNDPARALPSWQAAVEADPNATAAMSGLAKYAVERGCYDEAISWYEKWLKVDPQNADAKIGVNRVKQTQAAIKDAMMAVDGYFKKMDAGLYAESYGLMDVNAGRSGFRGGGGGFGGGGGPGGPAIPQIRETTSAPAAMPAETIEAQRWEASSRIQREPLGKVVTRKVNGTSLSEGIGSFVGTSMIADDMSVPAVRSGRGGGRGGGPTAPTVDTLNQVTVEYLTDFEHQKGVKEKIVVVKNGSGQWRINSYLIDASWKGVDPLRAH